MAPSNSSQTSKVGPELPPHILAAREAKRKRLAETATAKAANVHESKDEPIPVPDATSSTKSIHNNGAPSTDNQTESRHAETPIKRAKTIGPTMGPFVQTTRSDNRENSEWHDASEQPSGLKRFDDPGRVRSNPTEEAAKPRASVRDEWMTLPPTKSDWAAKQSDPLQIRPRKFLTGSSAQRAGQGADKSWMETEAERKKRVAEEMMGLRRKQDDLPAYGSSGPTERDEELARQVKEYNERNRGKSLMEQHQDAAQRDSGGEGKKPDDPSKRRFDYEKDIASGGRTMSSSKIQDFVKHASSMDSKFSKGRYL
ncbi:hypothetical protein V1525DRAFT_396128 [Lipomyces kononenkoae]|uniref:Uncharacterized protein n=1 Tax=Lipomyces kononenkoae TaxID=34357 RepID=A0ACC3T8D2_LIPKO